MSRCVRPGLLVLLFGLSVPVFGAQGLTFPPDGQNSRSSVTQAIGPVRVTIDYSSPRVVRENPWGQTYVIH
jgi:hypothetical protein